MIVRLLNIAAFAITFAFVEAATVIFLRVLLGDNADVYQIGGKTVGTLLILPVFGSLRDVYAAIPNTQIIWVEQWREIVSLVMLLSFSWLAADQFVYHVRHESEVHRRALWLARLAVFLFAFGLLHIFFSVFLHFLINQPGSLMELDVLFLLPVPWVAPVAVSLALSGLFVGVGCWLLWRVQKATSVQQLLQEVK